MAKVSVAGKELGAIGRGLLVYVGVAPTDAAEDAAKLADKVVNIRLFADDEGKLNRSVLETGGGLLVISNFALLADARKGRRPSFCSAAGGDQAQPLHKAFLDAVSRLIPGVQTGRFGADMAIESVADGPVNIIIDIPIC